MSAAFDNIDSPALAVIGYSEGFLEAGNRLRQDMKG
jgi:hypothetical protein